MNLVPYEVVSLEYSTYLDTAEHEFIKAIKRAISDKEITPATEEEYPFSDDEGKKSKQELTANSFRHYFIIARLLHLALYHSINESRLCTLPFVGFSTLKTYPKSEDQKSSPPTLINLWIEVATFTVSHSLFISTRSKKIYLI